MHYVGIDWSHEYYDVVVTKNRQVVGYRRVMHGERDLIAGFDWLHEATGGVAKIGIETPHGPIVEEAMNRLYPVYSINPRAAERLRDGIWGDTKDDRRDAYALAVTLDSYDGADTSPFLLVERLPDAMVHLRTISRLDRSLRSDLSLSRNRLWANLVRYHPGVLRLRKNCLTAPWFPDLIEFVPTPIRAKEKTDREIEAWMESHWQKRLHIEPGDFRSIVSEHMPMSHAVVESLENTVLVQVRDVRHFSMQRADTKRELKKSLDTLSDPIRDVLLSMPGVGFRVCSVILSEAYHLLASQNLAGFRAYSGVAPVTKQSGKVRVVSRRLACNIDLRQAMHSMARIATIRDPEIAEYFGEARKRGVKYHGALRRVGDKMSRALFAMLRNGTMWTSEKST